MPDPYGGDGLLSPPTSASSPALSAVSASQRNTGLPVPRVHPLRPGSAKEIALINYLDEKILRITRRYAKKFSNESQDMDNTPGYTTYDQFVSDVDPLVDIVWISGTRKYTLHTCRAWLYSWIACWTVDQKSQVLVPHIHHSARLSVHCPTGFPFHVF